MTENTPTYDVEGGTDAAESAKLLNEAETAVEITYETTITVGRIDAICDELKRDRIAVAEAEIDLADAQANIEKKKAEIIGAGYASGAIDGSNKQARDAQEAQLIAESEDLAIALLAVRERQIALAEYRGQLAATEERASLYRAFLYSRARMPR